MAASNNRINIYINGKEIANEIGAIEKAYRALNKESKKLTIGSEEYNANIKDLAQLKSVLNDHRNAVSNVDKGYSLATTTLKSLVGMAGLAFGADAVIAYGREVMKAGVELTALERKARIVFAETLPSVTRAAEANATAMGLTAAQYTKAAAEVADLLIPMGFTRDASAQMSVQLTNLGGVLAEWGDGTRTAADTTEILRKALLGERDALEGLGIQITEEQVKTELQKKGYADLTGKALEQAKALVTLDMIMEKSTDAQTAYANGQDSLTRKSAEMSAKFAQIKEDLGRVLIPLFASLTAVIAPVVGFIGDLVSGFTGLESSQTRVAKSTQSLQAQFNLEIETLKAGNLSHDARNSLIDAMNKKYTEYLPNQIAENANVAELTRLQDEANKKFNQKITLMAAEGALVETQKKLLDVKRDELGLQLELTKQQEIYAKRGKAVTAAQMDAQAAAGDGVGRAKIAVDDNIKQQAILRAEYEKTMDAATKLGIDVEKALGGNDSKKTITPNKAMSTVDPKDAEKAQKDLEKKLADIQALIKKHEDDLKLLDSQALKDIAARYDAQILIAETAIQKEDLIKRKQYELELQRDTEAINAKYQKDIEQEQILVKDKNKAVSDAAKAAIITLDDLREKEIKILRGEREKKRTEEEVKTAQERAVAVAKAEFDSAEESRKFLEQRKKEGEAGQTEINKFLMLGENKEQNFTEEVAALDAHYLNLLAKAEEYGLNVTGLKEKYEAEKANIDKKYKDKELKSEAEKNKKKLELQGQVYTELGNIAGSLSDIFQTEGEKQNAFFKTMALAQIAFDTAAGISRVIAMSVDGNPVSTAVKIATGIALVLGNIARAKKILGDAPEVKKQKYMGGFETVTGATDGKTYNAQNISQTTTGLLNYPNPVITPSGVLANERGMEYYVSATDLRKPVVMNHVRAIEAIRTNGITQRVDGGPVNVSQPNTPPQAPSTDNTLLINTLMKQNELLTLLLTQGVQAKVSDKTILDIEDRFQTLNNLSNSFYRN
jgi:hypothetical protein